MNIFMDNIEKEKGRGKENFEFHQNNHSNDYKLLVQRLKSISESIYLLEKNFFNKKT